MCSPRKQRLPHCAIAPVCSTGKNQRRDWPGRLVGWATRLAMMFNSEGAGRRVAHAVDRFHLWYSAGKIAPADGATRIAAASDFARPTALRLVQKCARPDRGCPGGSIRSMQGGWGAQHRSDMQLSFFGLSRSGILVSTDIGVAAWAEGSMFFLKMLTRCGP